MSYQGTTTESAVANTVMKRDGNANTACNNFNQGSTSTAGIGTTTTLTAASTHTQIMTGTITGQSFNLPNATTLALGWEFVFDNQSTGATLTVRNASSSVLYSIPAGGAVRVICTSIASSAGTWSIRVLGPSNATWGTTDGLAVTGPLFAGTLAQFRVDSSGNTTIPLTGVMTGNGSSAVSASTVTQHGVVVGGASNAVTSTAVGATGTFLGGNTGADPTFQTLASGGAITTITGNSGGAESPSSGNFNILGTGSITVAGTANTETVQLTGLTNHSLLVGAATATITNLGVATNGQLPIGSTGADPVLATISAGTNATVTNGAGSITIAAPGATRVLLSSQAATNSTAILFTSLISGTYSVYELEYFNAYPSTNAQALGIQFSTDNGATYISTSYIGAVNYVPVTSTTWVSSNTTSTARISAGASATTTDCSISGSVRLYNLNNGGLPCVVGECIFFSTTASATASGLVRSVNTANTNINAFQVLSGSGNIAQGTFNLYGIL